MIALFDEAFSAHNDGYRPEMREAPNGDGRVDYGKRYAHVNPHRYSHSQDMIAYYWREFALAERVSAELHLPPPGPDSTLRFLEYPPGVGGERHTDFSLFTRLCYQSRTGLVVEGPKEECEPLLHIGEIAQLIRPTLVANPHYVEAGSALRRSVVFFAIPRHEYMLPSGLTVGEWIAERKARSRINVSESK